jgi:PAS domain-containing protein
MRFDMFLSLPYLLAFQLCFLILFLFIQLKSKAKEGEYFQELSNSFQEPAIICDLTGRILFANQAFVYLYGPQLNPISELLDISDIKKVPLGTDTKLKCKYGRNCNFTVYKLMNRTNHYQDELFVITIKEKS